MSPTPERARRQIWRDIHDALIGTHRDFTEGPIGRAVFLLAIPMILEMAMESLFGIVDVFFVARLGTEAVATVALTEGMLTIVFGVAMGLSMATTAVVARRTGEKDPRGAAVATATGRGIGVAFQLWMLLSGRGRVVVRRADLKLNVDVLVRLARVSASGMMQFLVSTASWLGLVRIIALFGAAALAGYTIAIRIIIFAILPSWGMANAAATLVGQNLGAGKPHRAERSVWITGFYNMLFLAGVAIVFIAFAERLIGIFATDPEVLRCGTSCF